MPLVHGRSLLVPVRPDEGAAQRRRLLQDLERQWLEAWGQIGQAALPLHAMADPAGAAQPRPAHMAARQAPVSVGGPPARPDAPPPSRESDGRPDAPEHEDSSDQRERIEVEPVSEQRDAAAGKPMAAATGSLPGVPAGPAQVSRTDSSASPRIAMPVPSGSAAGLKLAPAGADGAALEPHIDAGAAEAAERIAVRLAAVDFRRGGPAQLPANLQPPATVVNPLPATAAAQAAPLQTVGQAEEQAAPAAQPRPASAFAETLTRGHRQLMLRELNEHEVLASMRDAQLTSSESALAAQGLVRALMQAGYARVQVFVNGRQHEHAADGDAASDFKADRQQAAEPPTSASRDGVRHGH